MQPPYANQLLLSVSKAVHLLFQNSLASSTSFTAKTSIKAAVLCKKELDSLLSSYYYAAAMKLANLDPLTRSSSLPQRQRENNFLAPNNLHRLHDLVRLALRSRLLSLRRVEDIEDDDEENPERDKSRRLHRHCDSSEPRRGPQLPSSKDVRGPQSTFVHV